MNRGGADLLLTHEGIALEEWNEVHAGWLNVLFPLKAVACPRVWISATTIPLVRGSMARPTN